FVPGTYPVRMVHCMGKLWVSAYNSYSSGGLNVIDESLRPQPYFIDLPKYAEIGDMACDASDRIWLAISDFRTGAFIGRFDAGGHFKRISLVGYEGGRLAADSAGGVWLSAYARQARLTLLHFDRHSAETTFYLPTVNGGEDPVTFDPDGRIWVGMNDAGSPVAVTELEPARVVK
ncbi:MAG TPA: hypothetical protein VJN22_05065, partial [Candidatus Eremiobacteraceae bacterium]|nr:hypothetical protein [Candidatus Eremiobacteraceae bacterium]